MTCISHSKRAINPVPVKLPEVISRQPASRSHRFPSLHRRSLKLHLSERQVTNALPPDCAWKTNGRFGRRLDPWPSQPTDRSPIACRPFAPAQSLRPLGLTRVSEPRYSELALWSEGIDGRRLLQGIGARQPNKGTPRGGFSLRSIDRLKQSAFMSVGDADNMPR